MNTIEPPPPLESIKTEVATALLPAFSRFLNEPLLLAMAAGLLFGLWPHINKAAKFDVLNGTAAFVMTQAVLFALVCMWFGLNKGYVINTMTVSLALLMVAYCHLQWGDKPVGMRFVFIAAICSSIGLALLVRMMRDATNDTRGLLLATCFSVQIMVAIAVHVYFNPDDIRWTKILGFVSLIAGTYLIHK